MYRYAAYGLTVGSDLPLPGLEAAAREPDLVVRRCTPREPPPVGEGGTQVAVRGREMRLSVDQLGTITVVDGREIRVAAPPHVEARTIGTYVLGIALAFALQQRGMLVLHASAVARDGGVAAFLGGSGWGKSSLAAALSLRSFAFIADDLVPVAAEREAHLVTPGFPQLKLAPDAAAVLGLAASRSVSLGPDEPKRGHDARAHFAPTPLPLHALYLIADAASLHIAQLARQAALVELIRHSYPTRLGLPGDAQHLAACAKLAARCPVFRLGRPRDLAALPELAGFVADHIATLRGPAAWQL
jgi:hypothetical protein